jgi:LPXTG-site transpeptidase (sortase) family protein
MPIEGTPYTFSHWTTNLVTKRKPAKPSALSPDVDDSGVRGAGVGGSDAGQTARAQLIAVIAEEMLQMGLSSNLLNAPGGRRYDGGQVKIAGHPGSTVLAAHVNWKGSQGPFSQLGAVEPGDQIEVALDDGTTRNYEVTERTMYGKLELPKERIWRNTGAEELVLITCGGEFNPEIRSFKSNIVVYAVPIA